MPIRNPFARRPGPVVQDENLRPDGEDPSHPGFERVDTVGSKASSGLSIRSVKSQDTGEYKMSGMRSSSCQTVTLQPRDAAIPEAVATAIA